MNGCVSFTVLCARHLTLGFTAVVSTIAWLFLHSRCSLSRTASNGYNWTIVKHMFGAHLRSTEA